MTAEQLDLVTMLGEQIDLPCDWSGCEGHAAWIVWTSHTCARHRGHGFLCDPCLQRFLTTERGLHCPVNGQNYDPARTWITRFERIDHKAARS